MLRNPIRTKSARTRPTDPALGQSTIALPSGLTVATRPEEGAIQQANCTCLAKNHGFRLTSCPNVRKMMIGNSSDFRLFGSDGPPIPAGYCISWLLVRDLPFATAQCHRAGAATPSQLIDQRRRD
jgi:hypothetical protein